MTDEKASATVRVDDDGRCYIPHQARKALGIHGKVAHVTLEIEVLRVEDDEDSD